MVDYNGNSGIVADKCLIETGMFTIHTPHFTENKMYDFIWDNIVNDADVFQKYNS